MEVTRKHLLDQFQENLRQSWEDYRAIHNMNEKDGDFITFLIDHQLIIPTTIRRFTILKEFENRFNKGGINKSEVVTFLSNKFNISERSIWNILSQGKDRYRRKEKR